MTYRLVITASAQSDLADIFLYIVQNNPKAARKLVAAVRAKIATLKTMPKRCPVAPENNCLDVQEVRHLIFDNYRVIFAVESKVVTILAIRHGARLPIDLAPQSRSS